jgi:hypothetical protein
MMKQTFPILLLVLDAVLCLHRPALMSSQSRSIFKDSSIKFRSIPLKVDATEDEDELDLMFNQIKDMNPEDVPLEIQEAITQKIEQNKPADWKIRLQIMGFNPLTIAGYGLAAVLITCNYFFGTGWAGDILGLNEFVTEDHTQVIQPRIGSNERFTNNYDGVIRSEVPTFELNAIENLL